MGAALDDQLAFELEDLDLLLRAVAGAVELVAAQGDGEHTEVIAPR